MARFEPPTARVPRHAAGRPVSCAWASAMNAAAPSWRVATTLIPTASRPSSRPRKLSPGTVNAQRTPARRIASANIRPTVIGSGGAAGSAAALGASGAFAPASAAPGSVCWLGVARSAASRLAARPHRRPPRGCDRSFGAWRSPSAASDRLGAGVADRGSVPARPRSGRPVRAGSGAASGAASTSSTASSSSTGAGLAATGVSGSGVGRSSSADRLGRLVGHRVVGPGMDVSTRLRTTITTTKSTSRRATIGACPSDRPSGSSGTGARRPRRARGAG